MLGLGFELGAWVLRFNGFKGAGFLGLWPLGSSQSESTYLLFFGGLFMLMDPSVFHLHQ